MLDEVESHSLHNTPFFWEAEISSSEILSKEIRCINKSRNLVVLIKINSVHGEISFELFNYLIIKDRS